MRPSIVFSAVAFVVLVPASFWCGSQWQIEKEKSIASSQARWVARYWQDGQSVGQICDAIARDQRIDILREQWVLGEGDDALLGPVVGGERLCVRRDRSTYWRQAR